jgi:hypothetical protein
MERMDAEQIFRLHYRGLLNPFTPVVVEYGFLGDGVAYELSRDEAGSLYGLTVVRYCPSTGSTQELRRLRYAERSLTAVRQRIQALRDEIGQGR